LERFDEDEHALFADDPAKFNRMVDESCKACQSSKVRFIFDGLLCSRY